MLTTIIRVIVGFMILISPQRSPLYKEKPTRIDKVVKGTTKIMTNEDRSPTPRSGFSKDQLQTAPTVTPTPTLVEVTVVPTSTSTPLPKLTQPKVTPTAQLRPIKAYDRAYVKQRICEVFGPACRDALIIALHESGYRLDAVSPTGDYGVMQINCYWHKAKVSGDCTKYFDLETNLRVAKQIYDNRGWNAWATKKFLRG